MRRTTLYFVGIMFLVSCSNQESSKPNKPEKEKINAKNFLEWNPGDEFELHSSEGDSIFFTRIYKVNNDLVGVRTYCRKCDTTTAEMAMPLSFYKIFTIDGTSMHDTFYYDTLSIEGYQAYQYYTENEGSSNNFYELTMEDINGEGYHVSVSGLKVDRKTVNLLLDRVSRIDLRLK